MVPRVATRRHRYATKATGRLETHRAAAVRKQGVVEGQKLGGTWESANALPCPYSGRSMGAQRAAWILGFKAEAARYGSDSYV